ncbi:unnamed protein product [Cuscuta campestris]|uniref:RanBP2-type domain-containing protein n=1 Tax=Cuscuta campestris TaxID=132261 RepID=A0A484MII6_9ASTE|nr:unnamed protein product [Cuscuta campestris]
MSSWACSTCTFINPPSQKSACGICLSAAPTPPPSPSKPDWPCVACTFLNPFHSLRCEVCGTRAPAASLSALLDTEDDDDPQSVGTVFLPLRSCSNRAKKSGASDPVEVVDDVTAVSHQTIYGSGLDNNAHGSMAGKKKRKSMEEELVAGNDGIGFSDVKAGKNVMNESLGDREKASSKTSLGMMGESRVLKILTYNVWFREDLEMHKRMEAIGELVQLHSPHIICFQEVTPTIYDIFQHASWWKAYRCSVSSDLAFSRPYFCMLLTKLPVKNFSSKPFGNSVMGRELCVAEIEVEKGLHLVVATSHLESPCPGPPKWDQMFSKERVAQAKESINLLRQSPNAILCGDMNWDDKLDGPFPLPEGWADAWATLRGGEVGYTYDTKKNVMLSGNRSLQKRLDRFLCGLRDFKMHKIAMIGQEPIPGLFYGKEKKVRNEVKKLSLPVLPSDHFGLLLEILTPI